jgi:hypothetical protein
VVHPGTSLRGKLATAMAGAALLVATHGAAALAGSGDRGGDARRWITFHCTQPGGVVWVDSDDNGVMDAHYPWRCVGHYTVRAYFL